MAKGSSLDEWVGKQVGVLFVPEGIGEKKQTRGGGTLKGVDQMGIMLSYTDMALSDDALEHSQRQWFIPWHKIEAIALLTD